MGKGDIFLALCLSFSGGIFIASFFMPKNWPITAIFFSVCLVGIAIIGIFWNKKIVVIAGFCLIIFSAGIYYFNARFYDLTNNVITENCGKKALIRGRVVRDPQLGGKNKRLTVSAEEIVLPNSEIKQPSRNAGKIIIFVDPYFGTAYGDIIEAEGELRMPGAIEDFDYQGFLAKDGISASMAYPEIKIVKSGNYSNPAEKLYAQLLNFKEKLREQMQKNLPQKEESVIQAMILGDSGVIGDDLKQDLSKSGLSHAIAISGMHIVLFSAFVFQIFIALGFWKKQAAAVSLILIIVYVIMAGSPASAVRSGIMAGLLLVGQLFDRAAYALRSLAMAGFLILLQNPLALKFDLGFELSFLAVAGIICAGPQINSWLDKKLFKSRLPALKEIIASTFSAQILTIPVIVNSFGYFSLASFFSNILAIPILAGLMISGIVFPVAGLIAPIIGSIVSAVCFLFSKYLLWVINFSAHLPFAVLGLSFGYLITISFYLAVLWIFWNLRKKKDLEIFWQ
ncbi:MAG: ComEC/Rec2 family competence protein [Candidatus Pacebacteria bacterium]|nr:ComEC/Rec2 family competence protein [Candidatus Paceibacterota bacterium]